MGLIHLTGHLPRLAALLLALALAGCSAIPREGPLSQEIEQQSIENDYVVVDVDAEVVRILADYSLVGLNRRFSNVGRSVEQVIGVGDTLSITVFEASSGGLFATQNNGNRADFPTITVDAAGQIAIPYAGRITVKSLTVFEVQDIIVDKLDKIAIKPQALVNIVRNENNTINISGDVTKPGLYPISISGRRLLDIVAEAGGAKFPARETYLTFVRQGRYGVQLLQAIIDQPEENIYVAHGDQIFLSHDPQRYTVLGAVEKPAIYSFDAPRVSALEAVANAGGLLDERADSTGFFIFRYEPPEMLERLNIKSDNLVGGRVPTIYRINMQHAKSYFYAQSFRLRDKDSLYVANARAVEIGKMLKLFNDAATAADTVAGFVLKVK